MPSQTEMQDSTKTWLDTTSQTITTALADFGASQVNLKATVVINNSISASLDASRSRIADADYAAESAELARANILSQSNIAMLAQANSSPQMVLKLLG